MLSKYIYSFIHKSIATIPLVAVLFLSCQKNNVAQIQAFDHPPGAPDVIAENMEVIYTDSAIIKFKLNSPILKIFSNEKEPYKEFPEGFKMQQYNKKKEIIMSIEASYGRFYEEKEVWEAKQNVVVVNEKGDSLLTELLFWDQRRDMIYTDKPVRIKQVDNEADLTGEAFESDLQLNKTKFYKPKGPFVVEVEE